MNLAHLHLLLNHFPTIGTVIGLGLFLLSLVRKNDHLKRASLEVFFVIALLTIPVYLSGTAAQETIEGRPGVSNALMVRHQDAALPAFVFMEITGGVAWLGLWHFRRRSHPARGNVAAVVLLSIATLGLMARAANVGGEIRHEEIRFGQEPTVTEGTVGSGEWLKSASVASFVTDRTWVWPASETLHFIGLCLLFGIVLFVNLRVLGMIKHVSFAALHRLLPWAVVGLGINTFTGMLFFIAAPEQYTTNVAFYWKIGLMLAAGANLLYLTVVDEAWAVGAGDDAPLRAKAIAASAIVLWVGVMYCGRMLPFIGNAF
jgi:hypothetical protein